MLSLTVEPASASSYYWTRSHAIGGVSTLGRQTPLEPVPKPVKQGNVQETTRSPNVKSENVMEELQSTMAAPPQTDPRSIMMPVCPALQTDEYKAQLAAEGNELCNSSGEIRPLSVDGHPPCQLCGVGIV